MAASHDEDGGPPGYAAAVSKSEPDEEGRTLVPSGAVHLSFKYYPLARSRRLRFQSATLTVHGDHDDPVLTKMVRKMNRQTDAPNPINMNVKCAGELTEMGYRVVTVNENLEVSNGGCFTWVYFARPV
jgi:hypothetical protein